MVHAEEDDGDDDDKKDGGRKEALPKAGSGEMGRLRQTKLPEILIEGLVSGHGF